MWYQIFSHTLSKIWVNELFFGVESMTSRNVFRFVCGIQKCINCHYLKLTSNLYISALLIQDLKIKNFPRDQIEYNKFLYRDSSLIYTNFLLSTINSSVYIRVFDLSVLTLSHFHCLLKRWISLLNIYRYRKLWKPTEQYSQKNFLSLFAPFFVRVCPSNQLSFL